MVSRLAPFYRGSDSAFDPIPTSSRKKRGRRQKGKIPRKTEYQGGIEVGVQAAYNRIYADFLRTIAIRTVSEIYVIFVMNATIVSMNTKKSCGYAYCKILSGCKSSFVNTPSGRGTFTKQPREIADGWQMANLHS